MNTVQTKDLLQRALAFHQAGRLDEAKIAYLELLAQSPNDADGLHLLGVLMGQVGQVTEGVVLIEKAITKNPRYSPFHNNLGNLLKRLGEGARARAAYHRAIRLDRRNADAYLNLGKLQQEMGDLISSRDSLKSALSLAPGSVEAVMSMGRLEEACEDFAAAAEQFRRAIELAPGYAAAHLALAKCMSAEGNPDRAEELLRKAIVLDPGYADAYFNLGNLERDRKRLQRAVDAYWKAIELVPAADAYNNLGLTLQALGRLDDAMAAFMKAIGLNPSDDAAFFNLGRLSVEKGNDDAAVKLFQQTITLKPKSIGAYQEMAAIYARHGEITEAVRLGRAALALEPDSVALTISLGTLVAQSGDPDGVAMIEGLFARQPFTAETHYHVYLNLGVIRKNEGRLEEAIACYRDAAKVSAISNPDLDNNLGIALALNGQVEGIAVLEKIVRKHPRTAVYRFNLGFALLMHGRYKTGWAEFEWWRKVDSMQKDIRPVSLPRWMGEPLAGKSILLYAEQGFGDTLQFLRYVPQVLAAGGRVTVMVQDALVRLVQGLPGIETCLPSSGPVPACDVAASLMALPRLCKTTLETIPAPTRLKVAGSQRTGHSGKMQVGLVWAGSPKHGNDRIRSMALAEFAPLAALEDVEFTSLQIGAAAAQASAPDQAIRFVADCSGVKDFADTAAIVEGLDLVITIDSAVAHLAGSMDKPVWMLHAVVPDWRWGLTSTDTPWYPGAKMFRQERLRDWTGVMLNMKAQLEVEAPRYAGMKELVSA